MKAKTVVFSMTGCLVVWLAWLSIVLPIDPERATFALMVLGLGIGFSLGVNFERGRMVEVRAVVVEEQP